MEVDELNPLVTLPTFEQGCVQPYTTPFRSRRHTIPRWLLFVVAIIGGCSHMCALAVEARPNSTAPPPRTWTASAHMCEQPPRSEEHTSELQSHSDLVFRLLL